MARSDGGRTGKERKPSNGILSLSVEGMGGKPAVSLLNRLQGLCRSVPTPDPGTPRDFYTAKTKSQLKLLGNR